MFGPGFGFLVLWSANAGAKRTGLDSIPCSPITWIAAEPARYNKSHVLFGVGRGELPLLSSFHPDHGADTKKIKIKKSHFHRFPWLVPARPDFARELPKS